MRPITPSPTGIEIGPPRSVTLTPRLSPSVPDMEIARIQLVAEMLLHLERERDRPALHRVVHGERVEDGWKRVRKFDVHHRARDLNDFADVHVPT